MAADWNGRTLAERVVDIDRRYPGLVFRIVDEHGHLRPHIRCFVNGDLVRDLEAVLSPADEAQIVQALRARAEIAGVRHAREDRREG